MSKPAETPDDLAKWMAWQAKYEQANAEFENMLAAVRKKRAEIEQGHSANVQELTVKFDAAVESWMADFMKEFEAGQMNILQLAPIHHREVGSIPMLRAAYSDRTAALMSKLARLAYTDFADEEKKKILESILTNAKFTKLKTLQAGETEALVAESEKFCVVAFRGTASRDDVRTDLQIRLNSEKFPLVDEKRKVEVKVHSGFLAAYRKVEAQLEALLAESGAKPIYLTGHSLGGALALIASATLGNSVKQFADRIAATYTFGAPRVGERNFAKIVKAPHYRVINSGDVVPMIPPSWLYGYVHSGVPILLKDNADEPIHRSPRGSALIYALYGLLLWPFQRQLLFLKRHETTEYEKRLHRIAIKRGGAAIFLPA